MQRQVCCGLTWTKLIGSSLKLLSATPLEKAQANPACPAHLDMRLPSGSRADKTISAREISSRRRCSGAHRWCATTGKRGIEQAVRVSPSFAFESGKHFFRQRCVKIFRDAHPPLQPPGRRSAWFANGTSRAIGLPPLGKHYLLTQCRALYQVGEVGFGS